MYDLSRGTRELRVENGTSAVSIARRLGCTNWRTTDKSKGQERCQRNRRWNGVEASSLVLEHSGL
jgi:hypothetical protein